MHRPAAGFSTLGATHEWAVVFPVGLRETIAGTQDSDVTWNCGTAADDATCLKNTTGSQCMQSCSRRGLCGSGGGAGGEVATTTPLPLDGESTGRCNWATCYDDAAFIDQLLKALETELCYDPKLVFLVGESNGAMFIHYLLAMFPGKANPLLCYVPVSPRCRLRTGFGAQCSLVTACDVQAVSWQQRRRSGCR